MVESIPTPHFAYRAAYSTKLNKKEGFGISLADFVCHLFNGTC